MAFTDLIFLFTFLPIALLIYYLVRGETVKKIVLLFVSFLFYTFGDFTYFPLLLVSMLINIVISEGIIHAHKVAIDDTAVPIQHSGTEKVLLVLGIVCNVAVLGYYKYTDFTFSTLNQLLGTNFELRKLALPLGLSFYTFKAISFLVDTYK